MKVIVPGSYDPVTVGHLDIIRAAAERYGEVYAAVFINENKKYKFTLEERAEMLRLAVADIPGVTVAFSTGRVIDFMRENGIEKIVKGYRNDEDLRWEKLQAEYNLENGGYTTELIRCVPEHSEVSSTAVRERLAEGGTPEDMLPPPVLEYLKTKNSK